MLKTVGQEKGDANQNNEDGEVQIEENECREPKNRMDVKRQTELKREREMLPINCEVKI